MPDDVVAALGKGRTGFPRITTVFTRECALQYPFLNVAAALLSFLPSALALAADPNAASNNDLLKGSARCPVMSVPLVEKPPTIDGTVDEQEWAGASLIPDLLYALENNDQRWGLPTKH